MNNRRAQRLQLALALTDRFGESAQLRNDQTRAQTKSIRKSTKRQDKLADSQIGTSTLRNALMQDQLDNAPQERELQRSLLESRLKGDFQSRDLAERSFKHQQTQADLQNERLAELHPMQIQQLRQQMDAVAAGQRFKESELGLRQEELGLKRDSLQQQSEFNNRRVQDNELNSVMSLAQTAGMSGQPFDLREALLSRGMNTSGFSEPVPPDVFSRYINGELSEEEIQKYSSNPKFQQFLAIAQQ